MFGLILLSATLLTYIENIAFYFYCIYIPYKIVVKGIKLAVWTLIYGGIILLVSTLIVKKWEVDIEEMVDEVISEETQQELKTKANYLIVRIFSAAAYNLSLMWAAIEKSSMFKKVLDNLQLPKEN